MLLTCRLAQGIVLAWLHTQGRSWIEVSLWLPVPWLCIFASIVRTRGAMASARDSRAQCLSHDIILSLPGWPRQRSHACSMTLPPFPTQASLSTLGSYYCRSYQATPSQLRLASRVFPRVPLTRLHSPLVGPLPSTRAIAPLHTQPHGIQAARGITRRGTRDARAMRDWPKAREAIGAAQQVAGGRNHALGTRGSRGSMEAPRADRKDPRIWMTDFPAGPAAWWRASEPGGDAGIEMLMISGPAVRLGTWIMEIPER